MPEAQSVTDEMRKLAQDFVKEVEQKVQGCGPVAEGQAKYIVENRLRERGLPPWAIDLMREIVAELIKKFMDGRLPSTQPEALPETQPAMVQSGEYSGD